MDISIYIYIMVEAQVIDFVVHDTASADPVLRWRHTKP